MCSIVQSAEAWKPISEFGTLGCEYFVSSQGRIYNKTTSVFVRPTYRKDGSLWCELEGRHRCAIDQLVANAFLSNPSEKHTINHIDGDKQNNCVENLEWTFGTNDELPKDTRIKESSEKVLENKIKRYLFEKGHLFFKVHGSKFMVPGISDIIACVCGRFVALEVKAPGKKNTESPQQKIFGNNVIKSNGEYYLVDNFDDVVEIIEGIERYEKRTIV